MAAQRLDFIVDGAAFALEEFGDGIAQSRVGDPVRRPGLHRLIAARQLVRSLCARFDAGQAAGDPLAEVWATRRQPAEELELEEDADEGGPGEADTAVVAVAGGAFCWLRR